MEYLIALFPQRRRVVVNGSPFGFTNTLLQIEAGVHHITLDRPPDFVPAELTVLVKETSALTPMTVTFRPASGTEPA